MRISGGQARGVTLRVPKGDAVRPATDGLRQAVFSSLGARVAGARFVDLFAGSGAYGLEALSRGAAAGVFVEKNAKAAACIHENITAVTRSLGGGRIEAGVTQMDALGWVPMAGAEPDLVFIDPPYELVAEVGPGLLERLGGLLAWVNDPLVVFEMPGGLEVKAAGWAGVKRLGKGARQPTAVFFRRE